MRKKKTIKTDLLKTVKDAIKRYGMIEKGDKVLVAVSGGPDSVCLLDVLMSLKKKLDLEIVVANMDHGIRGKESKQDSDFVKALCEISALKYVHKKLRLRSRGEKKLSIEEVARKERYDFLLKEAKDNSCGIIATGHTLDDQAETILMRVLKGTSLKGLSGIPPVRPYMGIKIVRPLIRCGKADILGYIKSAQLDYCRDQTNDDRRYLRNSVRKDILPYLMKYNPRLARNLVNLSDTVREDLEYIDGLKGANDLAENKARISNKVDISELIIQPKAVRKDVIKKIFISAGGNVKKLSYRHWIDIDEFVRKAEKGKSLDLPGKVRVRKTQREIIFTK